MSNTIRQPRKIALVEFPTTFTSDGHSYIGVTGVPVGTNTVTISTADITTPGFSVRVKDETGTADPTKVIAIVGEAGQSIDGQNEVTIDCQFGSKTLTSNGIGLSVDREIYPRVLIEGNQNASQSPTPGSAVDILFGGAQGTGSTPVQLSAGGLITINEPGQYTLIILLQIGRTTGTGVEELQVTYDINTNPVGFYVVAKQDTAVQIDPKFFQVNRCFAMNATIRFRMTAPIGDNDIRLIHQGIGVIGAWGQSPSARLVVLQH